MYTMDWAKAELKQGWIEGFQFERIADGRWLVVLKIGRTTKALTLARGGHRFFKTLDAAVKAVEEIGFSVDYLSNKG